MGRRIRVRVEEVYDNCHAVWRSGKLIPEPLESLTVYVRKPVLLIERIGKRVRVNDRVVEKPSSDLFGDIRDAVYSLLGDCDEDERAYWEFQGSPCPSKYRREFLCPRKIVENLRRLARNL